MRKTNLTRKERGVHTKNKNFQNEIRDNSMLTCFFLFVLFLNYELSISRKKKKRRNFELEEEHSQTNKIKKLN